MDRKILVTGDYWHREFKQFLAGCEAVSLIPLNKIETAAEQSYDLIVIAQSQPDQVPPQAVEKLQSRFGNTPVVAILGSWCEGEQRTGKPWPGVERIYWHRWQGRYATFIQQLELAGITDWHSPATSSTADRILNSRANAIKRPHFRRTTMIQSVAVSAATRSEFEMLRDAIEHFGWKSQWIERSAYDSDSDSTVNGYPICVVADAGAEQLEQQIDRLKVNFPMSSLIMITNFPRVNEVDRLISLGISQVISKPFELNDLRHAVERAASGSHIVV